MIVLIFLLLIFACGANPLQSDEPPKGEQPKVEIAEPQKGLWRTQKLKSGDKAPTGAGLFKNDTEPACNYEACRSPWLLVGNSCIFIDLALTSITNWNGGRNYCKEKHEAGDLATFRDANEFAEVLQFLRKINPSKKEIFIWIGGRDENKKGNWEWVNGFPMPMGSPYWGGDYTGGQEPDEANNEHCGILHYNNRYLIHDASCNLPIAVPLCQYRNKLMILKNVLG